MPELRFHILKRARRVGQQHDRAMIAPEAGERIRRRQIGHTAIVQHAPDIADQRIVAGRDFVKTGENLNGHGSPTLPSREGESITQPLQAF